jgi:hypothetical protein
LESIAQAIHKKKPGWRIPAFVDGEITERMEVIEKEQRYYWEEGKLSSGHLSARYLVVD